MKKKDIETEKDKAVENAIKKLQKKHGNDIAILEDKTGELKVEFIPTDSLCLDEVLGGGLPRGRLIELFGQESSGKSSLAQFLIGQVQKAGYRAALIDAEFCYDSGYTASLGVDTKNLLVSQPLSLEAAMDTMRELLDTKAFGIIVLDSVAAMAPQSELEDGKFMKDTMALQARKLGTALRVLAGAAARSNTTVIFINQIREKVNILWGKKETTPGGKALKFFSSIRLEVKKGSRILDEDDRQIGNILEITGVKNKIGWPYLKTSMELYYGKGPNMAYDLMLMGEKTGVITRSGNTYSVGEKVLGASHDKAKKTLEEDSKLFEEIKKEIKKKLIKKDV